MEQPPPTNSGSLRVCTTALRFAEAYWHSAADIFFSSEEQQKWEQTLPHSPACNQSYELRPLRTATPQQQQGAQQRSTWGGDQAETATDRRILVFFSYGSLRYETCVHVPKEFSRWNNIERSQLIIILSGNLEVYEQQPCDPKHLSPGVSSSYQYHRELAISGALFNLIQVCVCGIGIRFKDNR